jgi:hypothetical protein
MCKILDSVIRLRIRNTRYTMPGGKSQMRTTPEEAESRALQSLWIFCERPEFVTNLSQPYHQYFPIWENLLLLCENCG